MKYASATDVRGVLLGLLVLVSFFAYGVQHTRYVTAVKYLRKAAERNLGPKQGGNAAVRGHRKIWRGLGGNVRGVCVLRFCVRDAGQPVG